MIKTFFQKCASVMRCKFIKIMKCNGSSLLKERSGTKCSMTKWCIGGINAWACDQLLTTGKTEYPHIEKHHHCYLWLYTGNARVIILSILKAASRKPFPFTANAIAIFMKLRNTGLTRSLKNYSGILLIPLPVRMNAYNFGASACVAKEIRSNPRKLCSVHLKSSEATLSGTMIIFVPRRKI